MKKLISVILCITMLMSLAIPCAVAAEAIPQDNDPIIVVRGIDFAGLTYDDGSKALKIDAVGILETLFSYIFAKVIGNDTVFVDTLIKFANNTLAPISSDKSGNSVYENVGMKTYPLSVDNYPEDSATWEDNAIALSRSFSEQRGAGNAFLFTFDWRKSPMVLADELNAFIENVKAATGKNVVDIVACSMGGMVTAAYLDSYGYSGIDSLIFNCSAHNGVHLVGDAFTKKISIDGDFLESSILSFAKGQNGFIQFLLKAVGAVGIYDYISEIFSDFLSGNIDRVYNEALKNNVCTSLGLWGMIPDEYFDSAVESIFPDGEENYPELMAEIAEIREFVFSTEDILNGAEAAGIKLSFLSNYDRTPLPIYEKANWQTDGVIESERCSNGATFARVGETLSDEYIASADAKYISPDKLVDASTALFPDQTWFIKNVKHVGCKYGSDQTYFIMWLSAAENQITADSCAPYSQFMACDDNGNFVK